MNGRFVFVPNSEKGPDTGKDEMFPGVKAFNSVPETAKLFGVCPQTVWRLINKGELESVHIGRSVRITNQALIDFIEKQEVI